MFLSSVHLIIVYFVFVHRAKASIIGVSCEKVERTDYKNQRNVLQNGKSFHLKQKKTKKILCTIEYIKKSGKKAHIWMQNRFSTKQKWCVCVCLFSFATCSFHLAPVVCSDSAKFLNLSCIIKLLKLSLARLLKAIFALQMQFWFGEMHCFEAEKKNISVCLVRNDRWKSIWI